jgi:hypothetical protein
VALKSTQPLTDMCTGNIPGAIGRLASKTGNHTAICEPTVWILQDSQHVTTLRASTTCDSDSFHFFIFCVILAALLGFALIQTLRIKRSFINIFCGTTSKQHRASALHSITAVARIWGPHNSLLAYRAVKSVASQQTIRAQELPPSSRSRNSQMGTIMKQTASCILT